MIFMYADDTKLSRRVVNEEDAKSLQLDLNIVSEWSEKWQLYFNLKKIKVMHFGARNIEASYEMAYDQGIVVTLDDNTEERDLGV
jgi:ribosomal protein L30E